MLRKPLYLFLTLMLVAFLAVVAQSPTSSNPGGSETKDPYGATLDHPNPRSAAGASGKSYNSSTVKEGQTPAASKPTEATPSTTESSSSATSSTSPSDTSSTAGTSTDTGTNKSLPRTASDLPLLATL